MKKLFLLPLLLSQFTFSEIYPIDNWAVGSAMGSVGLSNDGRYISFMQSSF